MLQMELTDAFGTLDPWLIATKTPTNKEGLIDYFIKGLIIENYLSSTFANKELR